MPKVLNLTDIEMFDRLKEQKRNCYHKNRDEYNLISKKGYYKRQLLLHPEKAATIQAKIDQLSAEIERIKSVKR